MSFFNPGPGWHRVQLSLVEEILPEARDMITFQNAKLEKVFWVRDE